MKVIHIPYSFPPDPVGGTEIYVANLATLLQGAGVETLVCAPGRAPATYAYAGLRVRRWTGTPAGNDASFAYDEGDPIGAAEFDRLLDEERPDIVHFHSFTAMASLRVARRLHARGIPVVFTYHVPSVSCQRVSLLLWGRSPCDGRMLVERCTACSSHGKGVPLPVAKLLGKIPVCVGRGLQQARLSGGALTALRMTHLVQTRHESVRAFLALADRIVAPSHWVKDLLVINGVAAGKVMVCPQGVPAEESPPRVVPLERRSGALAMAFMGRLDWTKGVDVVLDALEGIPEVDLTFDVYGLVPPHDDPYSARLIARMKKDPRVRLMPAVPSTASVSVMSAYDLLVVPSQWLETGPLVVLEAFAAGIPVLGSRRGGIADRVRHGVDGLLIEADDANAWAREIRRLAQDRTALAALKAGVKPPPTMTDVASAMTRIYDELARQEHWLRGGAVRQSAAAPS